MDETLKTAYNIIKRKRYTHHFCENIAFTTAQEKYMIRLIRDGLELPTAVIDHVSDGDCNERFHILNEEYGCSCGYIIKRTEYHDHFRCKDHMINNDLKCYRGNVYFPVDLWQNPFGEFQPGEIPNKKNVEKFYEIIKQTGEILVFDISASDMCKYTTVSERYLIKLITEGADISEAIMNHVADGCDLEIHTLDVKFLCAYGFVIKRSELPPTHNFRRCKRVHSINNVLLCRKGEIEYSNEVDKNVPGRPLGLYHSDDSSKSYRRWQIRNSFKDMMDRWMLKNGHKRASSESLSDISLPQEKYLYQLLSDGQNIPIEITSHVIYGCDIRAHLLDENYGCCYGYILTRKEFLSHDFLKCNSKHKINRRLKCRRGTIDRRAPRARLREPREQLVNEVPTGSSARPWKPRESMTFNKLIQAAPLIQPNLPDDEEDYPRIIVPAPPPPDPLD